ncbi:hypothetical protein ABFX02_06G049100 [Erythranthe guttata]
MKKVSKLVPQRNAWRFLLPGNTTTTTTHRKRKTKMNKRISGVGTMVKFRANPNRPHYIGFSTGPIVKFRAHPNRRYPLGFTTGPIVMFRANPNHPNYPLGFSKYEEYRKYAEIALDVYNKTHPIKYSLVDLKLVVGQIVMQQLNVVFTANPNSDADFDDKNPITFRADVRIRTYCVKSVEIVPPSQLLAVMNCW